MMGPSVNRFLVVRAALGATVAALVAMPMAAAPPAIPALFLGWIIFSSLAGFLLRMRGPGWQSVSLGVLLAVDLAAEALLVATTGISRSPFVLLFTLTIAAAGLFFGVVGGLVMALGATICYWGVIFRLAQEMGVAPILTTLLLMVLGLLFGRLGSRMTDQSREMNRVKDELERVRLDAETIVASLRDPLLCLDSAGGIRRINRAAASLLGLRGNLIGARLSDVADLGRVEPFLEFVADAFKGELASAEIDLPSGGDDPPTPIEVSASRVRDRDGLIQGLMLLLTDLTRRREQEAEQARKERLAVIGELSGHLAHEIRNSLKPVVGSVQLLEGEIPREGTAGELMGIILRESESLETFLSDFLVFSRDKTLTLDEFVLDELIEEQIAALRRHPARKKDVELQCQPDRPGETILTDRTAVRDIVRNLIINGLEATSEGNVRVFHITSGPDIEIVVEDTGAGLPEGDQEQLFEPFVTHKLGGTGLGLSIARRLARRLSGEIVLERREHQGTRSRLLLRACRVETRVA